MLIIKEDVSSRKYCKVDGEFAVTQVFEILTPNVVFKDLKEGDEFYLEADGAMGNSLSEDRKRLSVTENRIYRETRATAYTEEELVYIYGECTEEETQNETN